MKKVSAATITDLTAAAALAADQLSSPPSVDELLNRLRATDPDRAKEFETLLEKMPQGFALVPVLYTRVAQSRQASMDAEYTLSVRQRFIKFLGQTQQQALRDLGICEHGIARMARGLDPANVKGDRYEVSVDHMIERSGCGTMAEARVRDAVRDDANADTYAVNHFNNLVLLPQDVHDYKNRLNNLQSMTQVREGESRWVLMIAPVVSAQNPGFVCPPPAKDSVLGKLVVRPPSQHQKIGEIKSVAVEALETMQAMLNDTATGSILGMLEQLARHNRPAHAGRKRGENEKDQRRLDDAYLLGGHTVADLGVAQPRSQRAANNNTPKNSRATVPSAPNTLRAIFNAAVSHDAAARTSVEETLRPRLREVTRLLEAAYAPPARDVPAAGQQHYREFTQFFRGRSVRMLCLEASHYPLAESRELLQVYRRIDRDLKNRQRAAKQLKTFKKSA